MSGQRDRRNVRRDRPHDDVVEVASERRPSRYHDQRDTLASSHTRDSRSNLDGARPRYVHDGQPQSRGGHRVDVRHEPAQPQHLETSNRHGSAREIGRRLSSEPEDRPSDASADTERHFQMQTSPQGGHRSSRPVQEHNVPREPIATSRPRPAPSTASEGPDFSSELSPLAAAFISIRIDEYASCMTFIAKKPEILDENENHFIRDATAALASNQSQRVSNPYARRCIQQALLLRQYKRLGASGGERFFAKLVEEDKKTASDFLKESATVLKTCEDAAKRLAAATAAASPYQPAPREAVPQRPDHASRQHSQRDEVSHRLDGLTLSSSNRHGSGGYGGSGIPNPNLVDDPGSQSNIQRRSSLANTRTETLPSVTINQGGLLRPREGTVIRGTRGEAERLDATYFRRDHAATFFIHGRVFALLWHESAGESNSNNRSDRFSDAHPGRFNEPIISHIRRMVVVRTGHGNCWAIPINTYQGWGVAKRGFNALDVAGHAVIHASDLDAYVDPGEPLMSKRPLMVNMVPGERLDRMSRVNFTTIHTVQHNVKVKNIGLVHQNSRDDLRNYWNAQCAN